MKILIFLMLSTIMKYILTLPTTVGTTEDTAWSEILDVTASTVPTDTAETNDNYESTGDEIYTPPDNYTLPPDFTAPTGRTKFSPAYLLSTTGKLPELTTLDRYMFESVDYEQLPQKLKDDYNDCYGQHIRCVRHRTDHVPVCGYNLWSGYYSDFYGPCEIDLQNCYHRMKHGFGVYGTNYKNDVIFYNGEGYNCIYYVRTAKSKEEMDELYFGDEIYRIKEERK